MIWVCLEYFLSLSTVLEVRALDVIAVSVEQLLDPLVRVLSALAGGSWALRRGATQAFAAVLVFDLRCPRDGDPGLRRLAASQATRPAIRRPWR
jgi:hypothetical protein